MEVQKLLSPVRLSKDKAMLCIRCLRCNHTNKFCKAKCSECHLTSNCTSKNVKDECPFCNAKHSQQALCAFFMAYRSTRSHHLTFVLKMSRFQSQTSLTTLALNLILSAHGTCRLKNVESNVTVYKAPIR